MPARIVVTEFASLDGVMQAPGGEDFKYKGWCFEFDRGDDGNQFKLDETMQRRRAADRPADLRELRRRVAAAARASSRTSSTRCRSSWCRRRWASRSGTTRPCSAAATRRPQVRKLKEEFDGELQVPGSHRLVQELIESDLVDQINLMVFPVVLGTGKKVFEETPERRACG